MSQVKLMVLYPQPTDVKQFYNEYGQKEWERLDASAHARQP